MTVQSLISLVLKRVFKDFYGHERVRQFKQDQVPLVKAITRYGYECTERGWRFNAESIYHEIMVILRRIKQAAIQIQYLPSFLESAITKHIGMRAEELSAKAKTMPIHVSKIINDAKNHIVTAVVEPSGAELMAKMHEFQRQELRRRRDDQRRLTHQSKMQLRFAI